MNTKSCSTRGGFFVCACHDLQWTVILKWSLNKPKNQIPIPAWRHKKLFLYRELRRLHGFQIIIDGFQFIISHTLTRVPWPGRIGNQLTHPEPVFKVIITPAKNSAAAVCVRLGVINFVPFSLNPLPPAMCSPIYNPLSSYPFEYDSPHSCPRN